MNKKSGYADIMRDGYDPTEEKKTRLWVNGPKEKRVCAIGLLCTKEERMTLKEVAKNRGMTFSEFIRTCLFNEANKANGFGGDEDEEKI